MDRPQAPKPAVEGLILVPHPGGEVREVSIKGQELGVLRLSVGLLAAVAVGLLLWVAFQFPKVQAHEALIAENLELKEKLGVIDRQMSEMEAVMLRLRFYQSQVRSLTTPDGDHGPIPEGPYQGGNLTDAYRDLSEDVEVDVSGSEVMELESSEEELQPATAWAGDVERRFVDFLSLFEQGEPDLNALMNELELLRAINESLPSYWPAKGRLSSGYGWRSDPMRGTAKFHSGIDIANRRGTPIYAAAGGVVSSARYMSGYGYTVEIDHGFGISTRYAHCNRLKVKKGQRVDKGELVATMGSTGRSTGPHLHFELRIDGSAHDPMKYLR